MSRRACYCCIFISSALPQELQNECREHVYIASSTCQDDSKNFMYTKSFNSHVNSLR